MGSAGARVLVAEVGPIAAFEACVEGFEAAELEVVLGGVDVFVTEAGALEIAMLERVEAMDLVYD
eukprot:1891257-Lingulodinium_polyedra.AAC.1